MSIQTITIIFNRKLIEKERYTLMSIHVTYDNAKDGAGYSIFVKANTSNEDKVLQYAIDNHLFEEDGDEKYVDKRKRLLQRNRWMKR